MRGKKSGYVGAPECGYCLHFSRIQSHHLPFVVGHCVARAPTIKGWPTVGFGDRCGQFLPVGRSEGERIKSAVLALGPSR